MRILVTGCAGFVGMHVARRLLGRGEAVIGLDDLNDYYDPRLKRARLQQLTASAGFEFLEGSIVSEEVVARAFARQPSHVVHLAAQPGIRYAEKNPIAYLQTNVLGFGRILEGCRHHGVQHLVYASSSSVYGGNPRLPLSVRDRVDNPLNLYAATKASNELMAQAYTHLYGFSATGLRFFTVYGPWGRPDMAPWLFTAAMLQGKPIELFDAGRARRDFTYVDDIAEATVRCVDRPNAPPQRHRILNVGCGQPVDLRTFVQTLEAELGVPATIRLGEAQAGDMSATWSDNTELRAVVDYEPSTPLREGLKEWVRWFKQWTSQ